MKKSSLFDVDCNSYKMSVHIDFYNQLMKDGIIYHDNREPHEEWLAMLYKLFFNKYNCGKYMFFIWKDIDDYHSYTEVDISEYIILELEIPRSEKVLKVNYEEWSSLGMDLFDNACNIDYANDYFKKKFNCDIYDRMQLCFADFPDTEYQYMIPYLKSEWVKSYKYINRLVR